MQRWNCKDASSSAWLWRAAALSLKGENAPHAIGGPVRVDATWLLNWLMIQPPKWSPPQRIMRREGIIMASHQGIHHVTAIAGPARRNLDFYTRVLGLRLVKKTV